MTRKKAPARVCPMGLGGVRDPETWLFHAAALRSLAATTVATRFADDHCLFVMFSDIIIVALIRVARYALTRCVIRGSALLTSL